MLKKQFQRKFENMQSGKAEKEEDLDSSMSDEGHQGSGPTTDVDDGLSTERNIDKLKSELAKSKWNSKAVQELLKATFTARRKAMLNIDARNRITKSLKEYRCLSHQAEFEEELLNCLEKVYNLKLTIESMVLSWKRLVEPILNLASRMKFDLNPEEQDSEFGDEIVALQCLPALFRLQQVSHKAKVQHVIVSPKEGSSFEETKAKASSSTPFLLYNPGQQILLMQNSKEEFMEFSLNGEDVFARAVISLIGIYYIFHLEYPAEAKGAYFFLQEHVLHDFLTKRPLRYAARLSQLKIPKSN